MLVLEIQLRNPSENNVVYFYIPSTVSNDHVHFRTYLVQLLSTLNIPTASSEAMAPRLASYIFQFMEENGSANLHLTAMIVNMEDTLRTESNEPQLRFRMEKLEQNVEDLGDCTICLDEINGKNNEVVKISCGHVYHKSCLLKWLNNCNSCPLCRAPLPLEEGSH